MNQAIAKHAPSTLADLLEKQRPELEKVLPKHLTGERLARVALSACSRSEDLLKCSAASILRAVMDAARLGLEPSGSIGGAHLVAHWNSKIQAHEAVLLTDYRGEMELARRSGLISSITCHVVHEHDHFDMVLGDEERLQHRPNLSSARGPAVGVYAIAHLKDGTKQRAFLSEEEVEHYRAKSRSKDKGPWYTDTLAMWKKTAIRRLCNMLPRSVEYADHVDRETEMELGPIEVVRAELGAAEIAPALTAGARLVAQLGAGKEPEPDGEVVAAKARHAAALSELEAAVGEGKARTLIEWHGKSMRGARTKEQVEERTAIVRTLIALAAIEKRIESAYAGASEGLGEPETNKRFAEAKIPTDIFARPLISIAAAGEAAVAAEAIADSAPVHEPGSDG